MRSHERTPVPAALPVPAPLPSLTAAFSRRRAIFGTVQVEPSAIEAADLALAQMRYARRALEGALEHGASLLAALGLPRLVKSGFVPIDPTAAGDAIEGAIAALDAMDSPFDDIEDGHDAEHDTSDAELDLGWSAMHSQIRLGYNTDDGDLTAPERSGRGFVRCKPDDVEDGGDTESEDYENGSDDGEDIGHFASDSRFTLQPLTEVQRKEIAALMRRIATVRRVSHV